MTTEEFARHQLNRTWLAYNRALEKPNADRKEIEDLRKKLAQWQEVLSAIERLIPKKPCGVFHIGDHDIYTAGLCPICNNGVNYEMAFCDACGQCLDWSVTRNAID